MIFVVMTDLVAFNRALADATRWRIVSLVMDEALCVCELADILEMPQSTVSSHVQVIRRTGMLVSERCEKWTYFRIDQRFVDLLREMRRYFGSGKDAVFQEDARKVAKRLAHREASCCPGPKKLKSNKKPEPQTSQ